MNSSDNNNHSQRNTGYRAVIPFYILYDLDLNANHIRLYGQIEQMESNPDPKVNATFSYAWIGKELGINRRNAMKTAKVLMEKGYIEHTEIGTGKYIWNTKKKPIIIQDNDENWCRSETPGGVAQRHQGGVAQRHPKIPKDKIPKDKLKDLPDSSKSGTTKILKDYEKDERFMRFYSAYPKKEDPRDARKAFKAVVGNDDELLEQIILDIAQRKINHSRWQDRQFIKNPAVYLRKGEFLGEIFNNEKEMQAKKEAQDIQTKEKMAEQERLSKKRADELLQYEQSKQTDSFAYKKTLAQLHERPQGLEILKKSMGMN